MLATSVVIDGCTCTPSFITSHARPDTRAAPTAPGSRWCTGRIPLNRWVAKAGTGINGCTGFGVRGVGVANGYDGSGGQRVADNIERAGQLWRDRHSA